MKKAQFHTDELPRRLRRSIARHNLEALMKTKRLNKHTGRKKSNRWTGSHKPDHAPELIISTRSRFASNWRKFSTIAATKHAFKIGKGAHV